MAGFLRSITSAGLLVWAILTACSLSAQAAVSQVSASVDKNPMLLDESVTLTVTVDDDVDRNSFDPSPLMKNFVVGRTSVSSQTQMINFDTTRTTTFQTVLIPRKEGQYTIPAFTIDGVTSAPINLMVLPVSAQQSSQGRDVYITTEVDSNEVYLQQQISYTVKLFLAIDLQRGSLSTPTLDGADVRQIGKDKEYQDIVNGKRYRIIERNFAIIPQHSGDFTIDGPIFEGEVRDNNRPGFGFFNQTKSLNRVAPAQTINVLPIPANYGYHWLPSQFVDIHEEWQPAKDKYTVGDPITRTLTLTAAGVVEQQLPEINGTYPDNVKVYPEKPDTTLIEQNNTLVAQQTVNVAVIPSAPGILTFPEIKVPWFNVKTKKTEFAVLPAKSIQVLPGAASTQPVPATPQPAPQPAPAVSSQPAQVDLTAVPAPVIQVQNSWWSVSSWVLLGVWLVTLGGWYWHSRSFKKGAQTAAPVKRLSNEFQTLQQALKSQQPGQIVGPLQRWLASYCGRPGQPLARSQQQLNNEELNNAIRDMLASQYDQQPQNWQNTSLKQVIMDLQKQRKHSHLEEGLAPLYS